MLLWGAIAYGLVSSMRRLTESAGQVLTMRYKVNRAVQLQALRSYLKERPVAEEDIDHELDQAQAVKKVKWQEEDDEEKWNGAAPEMEIVYDEKNAFLLSVFIQLQKGGLGMAPKDRARYKDIVFKDLEDAGVFDINNGGAPKQLLVEQRLAAQMKRPDAMQFAVTKEA